jgi:2-oxoglutarate dehydrogenase E2 component (dihydrolipoamide succinyltransferase)
MAAATVAAFGWVAAAQAQPAPEGTPAPMAAPAPAPTAPAPADTAPAASTPAPDSTAPAPAKTKHHKAAHATKTSSKHHDAGDAAVDDLNAKSLSAAKAGTSFAPATKTTPAPVKSTKKPVHHHLMKKKAATPSAPEATPAPADSTGK